MDAFVVDELKEIALFETMLNDITIDDYMNIVTFINNKKPEGKGIIKQYLSIINFYCKIRYYKTPIYTLALKSLEEDKLLHDLISDYIWGKPIILLYKQGLYTLQEIQNKNEITDKCLELLAKIQSEEELNYFLENGYEKGSIQDIIIRDDIEEFMKDSFPSYLEASAMGIYISRKTEITAFAYLYNSEKIINYILDNDKSRIQTTDVQAVNSLIYNDNLEGLKNYFEEFQTDKDLNLKFAATAYRRFSILKWMTETKKGIQEQFNDAIECVNPWRISYFTQYPGCGHHVSAESLMRAVQRNSIEIVKYLFKIGCSNYSQMKLYESAEDINNIILAVIYQKNIDMMNVLMEHGFVFTNYIHCITETGDMEIIKQFIPEAMKYKDYQKDFLTLLFYAIKSLNLEAVKYFVENGYDINQFAYEKNCLISALSYAVKCESLEIVQYLVSKGAIIDHPNNNGVHPLVVSILMSQKEIFDFLLENKIDVNYCHNAMTEIRDKAKKDLVIPPEYFDPISAAVLNKDKYYLEKLLEYGFTIKTLPVYKDFIESMAINTKNKDVIDLVLANIDVQRLKITNPCLYFYLVSHDLDENPDTRFVINGVDLGEAITQFFEPNVVTQSQMAYFVNLVKLIILTDTVVYIGPFGGHFNHGPDDELHTLITPEQIQALISYYDIIPKKSITSIEQSFDEIKFDSAGPVHTDLLLVSSTKYRDYIYSLLTK